MAPTRTVLCCLFAALAGCSEDSPAETCEPGKVVSCPCPGSGSGQQVCNADGTGFAACEGCGSGGTGGSAGSGGVGGTGASAGASGAWSGKRTGLVKLDGNSLADDQGKFNALGASLFWGAWGYKHDRARLEQNLAHLQQHGFHYIRCLGVVGDVNAPDSWDGREIDWHWPDYADVIAGLTDLSYDQYGLRVEWTLIGDGQINIPNTADRYALADTFVSMSQGREHKIIHFEIANEAWQNGFDGSTGVQELRELSQYLTDKTEILVAASAPADRSCGGMQELYGGGVADLATVHFDRDTGQVDGHWRPVWQPWWVWQCDPAQPVTSNNEPIGPGSSVNVEDDPLKLVSGAIASFASGLPLHVFHSGAGVRGFENLWEMAGSDAFGKLGELVPPDVASWTRKDPKDPSGPLIYYAEDGGAPVANALWPELGNPTAGAVHALGAVNAGDFFVLVLGIKNYVSVEARAALSLSALHPQTGAVIATEELGAGQKATLTGAEAMVLKGTLK